MPAAILGVILCQILRGLAGTFGSAQVVGPYEAAVALREGSAAARAGVMRPVEGTMLTVAADAATAAQAAAGGESATGGATDTAGAESDLVTVFEAAGQAAVASLWRTPDLLPVLAQAGVVDAGGAGLVLLYDAFLHALDGRSVPDTLPLPPGVADNIAGGLRLNGAGSRAADSDDGGDQGVADLRYEVMYFLEAPDDNARGLQGRLGRHRRLHRGRRRCGLWNCHIHTDDIGAAIEAALDAGRPATSASPTC